mmetsp:Transcript_39202/g.77123  ORF Transcript_39202/g.77123 Transcript_39202/m.77123 type:complete len:117 (+) Transcript_39202:159-509(+)
MQKELFLCTGREVTEEVSSLLCPLFSLLLVLFSFEVSRQAARGGPEVLFLCLCFSFSLALSASSIQEEEESICPVFKVESDGAVRMVAVSEKALEDAFRKGRAKNGFIGVGGRLAK